MPECLLFIYASLSVLLLVMASTTIYTIEHFLHEKPKKRNVKKKPCLKNGKMRRKAKYVRIVEPERPSDLIIPDEEEDIENLDEMLKKIDETLDRYQELEKCLQILKILRKKFPGDPQILWRIGKAHNRIAEKENDVNTKLVYVDKGIEYCQEALNIQNNQADAHKWMAILVGYKGQYQATKGRIHCGKLFKKHLDMAIFLNPSDPEVQHMAGRFCWEIASLSWMEKKIAKSIFSEPLNCSTDVALRHFLQAEKLLGPKEWKENRLLIAKCYISKAEYQLAVEWLKKAKNAKDFHASELAIVETEELLKKYSKFIVCQCRNTYTWQ